MSVRRHHVGMPWPEAGLTASSGVLPLPARPVALADALGAILAEPLVTPVAHPPFDASAMDGWAVAGRPPWGVTGLLLAGQSAAPLDPGTATAIGTGAMLPAGTCAVVRSEDGIVGTDGLLRTLDGGVVTGSHLRRAGEECPPGTVLVAAGARVTPPVAGLAAASGLDTLVVHPVAHVGCLVLGDELLCSGLPHDGRIRDSLGPQLPAWLRGLGADPASPVHVGDSLDETTTALAAAASCADVVVTTGGTAAGPVDHLHPALERLGATLLVDGVAVRPGHPMLLGELPGGCRVVGLPGNPFAALVGVLTLARPLLAVLSGRPPEAVLHVTSREDLHGRPNMHRLVAVVADGSADSAVTVLPFQGSAMLRGLLDATALAVVPPGGVRRGESVMVLPLPW